MISSVCIHSLQKCDSTWIIPFKHSPMPASKLQGNWWCQEAPLSCMFTPFTPGSQPRTHTLFRCLFWTYKVNLGITYPSRAPLLFTINLQNSWFHWLSLSLPSLDSLDVSPQCITSDWLGQSTTDKFTDVSYTSSEPTQIYSKSSTSLLLGKSRPRYSTNISRNFILSVFLLNFQRGPSLSTVLIQKHVAWAVTESAFRGTSLLHYCSVVSIRKFLKSPELSLYSSPHKFCSLSCLPKLKYCNVSLLLIPSVCVLDPPLCF